MSFGLRDTPQAGVLGRCLHVCMARCSCCGPTCSISERASAGVKTQLCSLPVSCSSDNRSRSCLFSCVFSPFEERLRSLSDILIHWLCFRETAVTLELRESFVSRRQSSAHCVSDNVPGSVGSLRKELKSHACALQGRIAAPRSGGKMQISGAGACQLTHHRRGEN